MSKYEVVFPLGRRVRQTREQALRPRTLDGVTIGELSNHKFDSRVHVRSRSRRRS